MIGKGSRARSTIAIAVAFLLIATSPAAADAVTPSDHKLPDARAWSGLVSLEDVTYLLGGYGAEGLSDEIWRYDPSTEATQVVEKRLPRALANMSATAFEDRILIFGGSRDAPAEGIEANTAEILMYRPGEGAIQKLQETLPDPRSGMATATVNGATYLFGGLTIELFPEPESHFQDEILRFSLPIGPLTTMAALLPGPRAGAAAVAVDDQVYVLGGENEAGPLGDILQYDPSTDVVTTMGASLPTGTSWATATEFEGLIYLFGGKSATGTLDTVVRYDPATDSLTHGHPLPAASRGQGSLLAGDAFHLLGGYTPTGFTDAITHYEPGPDPDPVAAWTFDPQQPMSGETVQFQDASHIAYGSIASRQWSFGDGATSTEASPAHVYSMPDTYSVTLAVTSETGRQATQTMSLTVTSDDDTNDDQEEDPTDPDPGDPGDGPEPTTSAEAPYIGIQVSKPDILQGEPVWFNATGAGEVWMWNFGDGNSSSGRNVSHAYTSVGHRNVVLTVQIDGEPFVRNVAVTVHANSTSATEASVTTSTSNGPSSNSSDGNDSAAPIDGTQDSNAASVLASLAIVTLAGCAAWRRRG